MIFQLPLIISPLIHHIVFMLLLAATCFVAWILMPDLQNLRNKWIICCSALQSLYRQPINNSPDAISKNYNQRSVIQDSARQDVSSHQLKKNSSDHYPPRKRTESPTCDHKSSKKRKNCPKKNYKTLFPLNCNTEQKDSVATRPSKEIFDNAFFQSSGYNRSILGLQEQVISMSVAEYDYYTTLGKDDCRVSVDLNHGEHYDALCDVAELIRAMHDDLNTLTDQLTQVEQQILNVRDPKDLPELKNSQSQLTTSYHTMIESISNRAQVYKRVKERFDQHNNEIEPTLNYKKSIQIKDVIDEVTQYYANLQNAFSHMIIYDVLTKTKKVVSHRNAFGDYHQSTASSWENHLKILPVCIANKHTRLSALIINRNIKKVYVGDQELDSGAVDEVLGTLGEVYDDYAVIKCYNKQQPQGAISIAETSAFLEKGLEMAYSTVDDYEQQELTFINTIINKSNENFRPIGNGYLLHRKGSEINFITPCAQDDSRKHSTVHFKP